MRSVASSKTVGELRRGKTLTQESELNLGVVEGWQEIEDFLDFPNPMIDDVASLGDGANRTAEKNEPGIGGARNSAIQGIGDVDFQRERVAVTTPNQ